jgi:hypothetical protein
VKRGRDGEVLEDEALPAPRPAHHCVLGWVGEDAEGRPVPCLICRPHVLEQRRRAAGCSTPGCRCRQG